MYSKHTAHLTDCLDLLASIPFLSDNNERNKLAQNIIDTLGGYPKPRHKNEVKKENPNELGAYLFTSTARNTAKLAQLEYIQFDKAFEAITNNLERALGLFTDERK
ncbi:MAG: hypothetical protein FWF54_05310 [Candidatus Azobacteroides sp.]|nr:hypothetical protein [Candidatus Azobacteroides sp.]